MVGVFDVLLHQLPVARNALAAVAQNHQLAAIEHAVKVLEDGGAQKFFQGLDIVVKGRKHHAAAHRHLEFGQAVIGHLEFFGHATVDLAFLLDAPNKGHALQVALEAVVPLVVGAQKVFGLAVTLAAKTHAPVGADVFHHVDAAVRVTHHDHRTLAHHGAPKVARIGNLGF